MSNTTFPTAVPETVHDAARPAVREIGIAAPGAGIVGDVTLIEPGNVTVPMNAGTPSDAPVAETMIASPADHRAIIARLNAYELFVPGVSTMGAPEPPEIVTVPALTARPLLLPASDPAS